MVGGFKMEGSMTAAYVSKLVADELRPVMEELGFFKEPTPKTVEDLTDVEAEHLLARALAYHVRTVKDEDGNEYVKVYDWSRYGTILDNNRFDPFKTELLVDRLMQCAAVKVLKHDNGWDAAVLLPNLTVLRSCNFETRGRAVVHCILKSFWPEHVNLKLLTNNPLQEEYIPGTYGYAPT